MNTAVALIDNKQGYSKQATAVFLAHVTNDVTKKVVKVIARGTKLVHTCTN